jgi:glyoxylate reductase
MTNRPRIFVARKLPSVAVDLLSPIAELLVHDGPLPPTREQLLSGVQGCAGILSLLSDRVDAEVMDAAGPQLKVISNFAVGVNNIDIPEANRRGISVGNTPEVLTDATADIAVGLILAASRNFRSAMQAVWDGSWNTWEPLGWIGQDLKNKTLGIVGMGRIGLAVAQRMHGGWNMRILYTSRSRKPDVDASLEARHVGLEELLSESDIVSLHVPLCEETHHLISQPQLSLMKPTGVLINTARGEIVDQDALVESLQQKQIFAAGLDVCTPEPLPVEHPLQRLTNCILLPHIGSATRQARDAMAERAARNLIAGIAGEPLPYPVGAGGK